MTSLNASEVAALFVQSAFRESKGDGAMMKVILEGVAQMLPVHGGAFRIVGTECHPHVPGCSKPMADWLKDFHEALSHHITLIRVGIGPHPIVDPDLAEMARRNRDAKGIGGSQRGSK
jgi:hypothetical protein